MAILGNILNNLLNLNEDSSSRTAKPCKNCPSSCELFPDSCELCKPFKEKLIDQLYDVEHPEEFNARYEVVGTAQAEGSVTCPSCGGPNPASAFVCEYCGIQLRESSGKIRVSSASEIPDPIQLAQDTIFERRQAVCQKQESDTGLLEGIANLLNAKDTSDDFGERMTNEEIEETAQSYGVSVSAYLQGMDNGKYLTASAKKLQQASVTSASAGAVGGAALGLGSSYIISHAAGQAKTPSAHPHRPDNAPQPPGPDPHPYAQHNDSRPGQSQRREQRHEQNRLPSNGHTPSHNSGKPGHNPVGRSSPGKHGRNR